MCQAVNILQLLPIILAETARNAREIIARIARLRREIDRFTPPFFASAASTRIMRRPIREVDVAREAFTGPLDPIESTMRISTEHENE
jgi:hypothetical protein